MSACSYPHPNSFSPTTHEYCTNILFPSRSFGHLNFDEILGLGCFSSIPYLIFYLRGAIVSRTYGAHKNPYIYLFLLTKFGPIYNGPP